jgi:hypothetical protein
MYRTLPKIHSGAKERLTKPNMKTTVMPNFVDADDATETFNPLLTTAQVSRMLRLSESFLEKARASGSGPRFVRIGERPLIRYAMSDVMRFVERSKGRTIRPVDS